MPRVMPRIEDRAAHRIRDYDRRIKVLENRLSVVLPDSSIPGVPTFLTPTTTFYQGPSDGKTKASVTLSWTAPTNTDGSVIADPGYYEIQYRAEGTPLLTATWANLAVHTWADLAASPWNNPLAATVDVSTDWHLLQRLTDATQFTVKELTPGVTYDFQIRFVDGSTPPNAGAWSPTLQVVAAVDTVGPSQPAAPTVASSLISVQVTSTLGKASGGTFNLEPDLHHLEVHGAYEPGFVPSTSTLLGKLVANAGLMTAQIPAVGSFGTALVAATFVKVIAVDISGNKSSPSAAASATAQLIDDQHISSLTVSKLLAGTVNASIILAGSIKTASAGARAEMDSLGIRLYDSTGNNTVNFSAADGSAVLTGKVQTGLGGNRIIVDPAFTFPGAGTFPTITLYDSTNAYGPARINATLYGFDGGTQMGLNSGPDAAGSSFKQATALLRPDGFVVKFNDQAGNLRGGSVSGDSLGGHLAVTNSSGTQTAGVDVNSDGTINVLSNTFPGTGMQVDGSGDTWVVSQADILIDPGTAFSTFVRGGSLGQLQIDSNSTFQLVGKFMNFITQASTSALSSGQFSVTANNGLVITWGSTMASTMVPICTVQNGSGGSFVCVTANNSTSFTMTANVTATQTFNWWAYRV